jgi:isoleucyl-tRNA synthetase
MADNSFKDTLNLPRTDFPIRSNAQQDDPVMIARWQREQLYQKSYTANEGAEKFVLHDGPPYANGHIHIGHAYNKTLKDIITKSQRMLGKQVPVKPGWDCHGLPIELKVTQTHPELHGSALKKACRAYAQQWIDAQKEEFRRLGVLMNWEDAYHTMDPEYQAAIVRAFGIFVAKGYIEYKNKTVPWCFSDKTVLAAAEIEYQDRKDPSVYVLFKLSQADAQELVPDADKRPVNFVVWTTTPWTLPLNRAVLLKPGARYAVIDAGTQYLIVGEPLVDALKKLVDPNYVVVNTVPAEFFIKKVAHHPLIDEQYVPVILDESVSLDDGTACVHCAPGAGPIDYEIGVRNNLEIFSPVGPDGIYTADVQPEPLRGMPITDGQWWVLKNLKERGNLLHKGSITHSYPHCWRCRNGLIFRATKQWFINLEHNQLRDRALAATGTIATVPEKSINRLRATLENRLEWCLSRQRTWGVGIPALLCLDCDAAYTSQELANKVADATAQHGNEWWDDVAVEHLIDGTLKCKNCSGTTWRKEKDIVDVWFESGVSHYAVLAPDPILGVPADMYLEGSDQHRAWFQSSLLTSVAIDDQAPMRTIVTHGFTVDDKGRKMSKSLGNVVTPEEIMQKIGTDGLRMWAASLNLEGDAVISDTVLNTVQEVFRKIRNTLRFLLSNLYDFDIRVDAVPLEKLTLIDQYALQKLYILNATVIDAYKRYDLTAVFYALGEYCAADLSALYLDVSKDRLYVEAAAGHARRSAQTAYWSILDTLTRLIAPIMSFTAEQVSDLYQHEKEHSIHLQRFADLLEVVTKLMKEKSDVASMRLALDTQWEGLFALRSKILKAIEEKRAIGEIKHPLEARIQMTVQEGSPTYHVLGALETMLTHQTVTQFLKEWVIVSQFEVIIIPATQAIQELTIEVMHARGTKCPRCWQWDETPHEHMLCSRCAPIVSAMRYSSSL